MSDEAVFKIKGDPGHHNTYINIGNVQNYNPNATTVINNNYGTREGDRPASDAASTTSNRRPSTVETRDLSALRNQVLTYVSCLSVDVAEGWRRRYQKLWEGILDLEILQGALYEPGKQQGTNFNRNLVANIIHYLGTTGDAADRVYPVYNAAQFTEHLEGHKDHPVRAQLGLNPSDAICSRLEKYLETFTL